VVFLYNFSVELEQKKSSLKVKNEIRRIMMVRKLIFIVMVLSLSTSVQAILIHQYTFNSDPTIAKDNVGTAHGTLQGTASVDLITGHLVLDGAGYADLPGGTIQINTLTNGFTLELWNTDPDYDQGYSMTAAFGGTQECWGKNYVAISTTRGDQVSRAMLTKSDGNLGFRLKWARTGRRLMTVCSISMS